MKPKTPKDVNRKMWAYFAPDGYLQVRSIGETKKEARVFVPSPFGDKTYEDYEREGYVLRRIYVEIKVL